MNTKVNILFGTHLDTKCGTWKHWLKIDWSDSLRSLKYLKTKYYGS